MFPVFFFFFFFYYSSTPDGCNQLPTQNRTMSHTNCLDTNMSTYTHMLLTLSAFPARLFPHLKVCFCLDSRQWTFPQITHMHKAPSPFTSSHCFLSAPPWSQYCQPGADTEYWIWWNTCAEVTNGWRQGPLISPNSRLHSLPLKSTQVPSLWLVEAGGTAQRHHSHVIWLMKWSPVPFRDGSHLVVTGCPCVRCLSHQRFLLCLQSLICCLAWLFTC